MSYGGMTQMIHTRGAFRTFAMSGMYARIDTGLRVLTRLVPGPKDAHHFAGRAHVTVAVLRGSQSSFVMKSGSMTVGLPSIDEVGPTLSAAPASRTCRMRILPL